MTGSHSDIDIPPNVPTINGFQKQTTHRESLTDVVSSAAAAIAKVLTPPLTPTPTLNSPNKTVDTRMKNLEQRAAAKRGWDSNRGGIFNTEKDSIAVSEPTCLIRNC